MYFVEQERARREARRQIAAEDRGTTAAPIVAESLRERLARPRLVTPWQIEGWQPRGSRVVLAAQFKAGKTTLTGNVIRSKVDRDPFLDVYPVAPLPATLR